MPRKPKTEPTALERLVEAERELAEALKKVEFYREKLIPLRQTVIAELAATSGPQERPEAMGGRLHHITKKRENGAPVSESG